MIKANYIKCNTYKDDYALDTSLIASKKGFLLIHNDHLFYQHRINNDTINWKCKMAKDKDVKFSCAITFRLYRK